MAPTMTLEPDVSVVNRRTVRTCASLKAALAEEVHATGDLSQVTATALADRAGVTRRTFYTHYHDVDELVRQVEEDLMDGLLDAIAVVSKSNLEDLHEHILHHEPVTGAVELLDYIRYNQREFSALLGPGGDAAFAARIEEEAVNAVIGRAADGLAFNPDQRALRYYVTSVVCAEFGVIRSWIVSGMHESSETMALALTMIAFIQPGDLYGKPIDFDISAYGTALLASTLKEKEHVC